MVPGRHKELSATKKQIKKNFLLLLISCLLLPSFLLAAPNYGKKKLTREQLIGILEKTKRQDLQCFAKDLYEEFKKANPIRETNKQRCKENRRLDAFARLLVGDEVCAAVAHTGKQLLVATNNDTHEEIPIQYTVTLKWRISENSSDYTCSATINVRFANNPSIGDAVEIGYRVGLLSQDDDSIIIALIPMDDISEFIFRIGSEQHNICGLSDIVIKRNLIPLIPVAELLPEKGIKVKDSGLSSLKTQILKNSKSPLLENLKRAASKESNLFKDLIAYVSNPLNLRLKWLINYLGYANEAFHTKSEESVLKAEFHKRELLKCCLAWEAIRFCGQDNEFWKHVIEDSQRYKEQLDKFISFLCDNFIEFGEKNHIYKVNSLIIETWWGEVFRKIENNNDLKPAFLQGGRPEDEERFRKIMKIFPRYFIDLYKLKHFVIGNSNNANSFVPLMLNKSSFEEEKIKILNECEGGVHAEIRVLLYLLSEYSDDHNSIPYIATSKLCCCHCGLVMSRLGVEVSGRHGSIYTWDMPKKFMEDENTDERNDVQHKSYLEKLLGDKLYSEYSRLEKMEKEIVLPKSKLHDEAELTQVEAALMIFQSIANLNSNDLIGLRVSKKKLINSGYDFADESDDENDFFRNPLGDDEKEKKIVTGPACKQKQQVAASNSKSKQDKRKRKVNRNIQLSNSANAGEKGFNRGDSGGGSLGSVYSDSASQTINTPSQWYTDSNINNLLKLLLQDRQNIVVTSAAATIFENNNLLTDSVRNALQDAFNGNIVLMPIYLSGNHWVGAVFRQQNDGAFQVVYNNPEGVPIDSEKNAARFIEAIQQIARDLTPDQAPNIVDLQLRQQCNGIDCGPFTVDNLIRMARNAPQLDDLNRNEIVEITGLQQPSDGSAALIRSQHDQILSLPTIRYPDIVLMGDAPLDGYIPTGSIGASSLISSNLNF